MIDQARLEEIATSIEHAHEMYNRLVLIVVPAGTVGLGMGRFIAENLGMRRLNVGLELSERMMDLSAWQRPLRVGRVLESLIRERAENAILLDNLEILSDVSLRQDPLQLIQRLSRVRTVVAVWSGTLEDGNLLYAVPGHPEYHSYPAAELLLVAADGP